MPLTSNLIQKQVDLPVWEWPRATPVVTTAGLSSFAMGDTGNNYNAINTRYMYQLLNATNFVRYDTVTDTYQPLASPPNAPLTASSIRFNGGQGFYNRVISATSTTITTGLPSAQNAVGYRIRIVSGTGAGQERIITAVSDPIVAFSGNATAGATTSITDSNNNFVSISATGVQNVNNLVGYMVRIIYGTGLNQTRKILYNTASVITIGDLNFVQNDPFANCTWTTTPAAGSQYQVESYTITVDSAWTTTPDNTSRYVIQSGGVWLLSGAAATPFYTLQYYDVLHDQWYVRTANTQMATAAPTDLSLIAPSDSNSVWWTGTATSGSTTTIVDASKTFTWTTNQWAGYYVHIFSGTGLNQIGLIASNTADTLTISTLGVAPAAGSQYQIIGYSGGTSSGSNTFNTFNDTSKSFTVNRFRNYSIRILAGTGVGQTRTILSNTATSFTLYRSWNIIPDNTSIYAIVMDPETYYITWGGVGEMFVYTAGTADTLSHGRVFDQGVACLGAAWLSNSSHTIFEQMPVAISSISGTTTITATTVQAHNFIAGQYVSIRGVTSAAADIYNVTGLVQIASVPSTTTFTYTPFAAGTGTYAFGLTALSTTVLTDASKTYADNTSSATTTTITFPRVTPSNINGWYVTGTNIVNGTRVSAGAGTATITLDTTATGTPSGTITIRQWAPSTAVTGTYLSGGGTNTASFTLSAAPAVSVVGWYVSGTGIAVNTFVSAVSSATIYLSTPCTGAVSGTITFNPPAATGRLVTFNSAAPAATTGLAATQTGYTISPGAGASLTLPAAAAAAPTAAVSKYVVSSVSLLGAGTAGLPNTWYSGVLLGTQSTTTAVDTNTFITVACNISAGNATITASTSLPGSVAGWYVSGTGISTGTWVTSIGSAPFTTITLSAPATSTNASASLTFTAFNPNLVGRRLKFTTATGITQDVAITAVTASSGTLTFGLATAGATGATAYSICSIPVKGAGHAGLWAYNNLSASPNSVNRGRFLILPRGGAVGIDKYDLTTDQVIPLYFAPYNESLTSGSMFSYDFGDRVYYCAAVTLRCYYIDVNTNQVYGAGFLPYIAGTAGIGNKADIFVTNDGLKFWIVNRPAGSEVYRQLLFY